MESTNELGMLAMRFRACRGERDRQKIRVAYERIVKRLIQSGDWNEVPAPEDLLPRDWMPAAYFTYWARQAGLTHEK